MHGNSRASGPSWRVGIRYEVALDAIGALLSHYSEIIGNECEHEQPDSMVLQAAQAVKKALRNARDSLNPKDGQDGIEAAILRFGPLARTALSFEQNPHPGPIVPLGQDAKFSEFSSPALDGVKLAIQGFVSQGVADADLALSALAHLELAEQ